MKFDDLWKKPMSKQSPKLPKTTKNIVDPSKKPGFNLITKNARTNVKCNTCQKPRIVYFQYKPSGQGNRMIRKEFNILQERNEFHCGDDTSKLFEDNVNLKSKKLLLIDVWIVQVLLNLRITQFNIRQKQ